MLDLKDQTRTALADIRRIVYDLRPPTLDELGLVGALREYVASNPKTQDCQITINAESHLTALPAAVEVAAYRITLEAINNCLRHAEASYCVVNLEAGDHLQVIISDDGRGLSKKYLHYRSTTLSYSH